MASSTPRPISASSSSNTNQPYDRQHHNTSTSNHSTSFSPSSSSSSAFLHPSFAASQQSGFTSMYANQSGTTPIPLSTSGRRASQQGGMTASGSGSFGPGSLARSLLMGSYGSGSLEERMRMGSWKGKFLGHEGGQPWGGIDAHDFTHMSTSIGSNNGYMKNEADYSQTYNCCGLELASMHDLLEHYEDVHVVILPSPATNPQGLPEDVDSMELDSDTVSSSGSGSSQTTSNHSDRHSPSLKRRHPIPASAPLQFSDVLAPPPLASGSSATFDDADSRKKTKRALAGRAAFSSTTTGGGADGESRYSYTPTGSPVPGDVPSSIASSSIDQHQATPSTNPASSLLAAAQAACNISPSASTAHISLPPGTINPSLDQSSGIPPPTRSGQKTFHCPTPGCQKSYKQQNGLKYHLKIGQCNFEVRDAVESGISEAEAEEKSRPFVCQVGGGCTKRYRQMNGLKYHYANSGAHGAIGLALIAQGKHTHPKSAGGASLPGGDSNGFTPKASGSPLAVGGGSIGSAAPSVLGNTSGAGVGGGGGPMVWQPQQPGQGTLDEVLFTAGGEDVDMEM